MVAASGLYQEAIAWMLAVDKKDVSHDALADPGEIVSLDAKLVAAISEIVNGELGPQNHPCTRGIRSGRAAPW